MVAVPAQDDLRRCLDDDGKPLLGARLPAVDEALLTKMFETMMLVRVMDERMMRLLNEGRLGFYINSLGEEANHLAAAALRDTDWIFPSYREHGAWFWRGYAIQHYIDQLLGNAGDPIKGRQLPVHRSSSSLHLVSISGPVGTQIPQAVGAAHAARALGKDDVVLVFFGEGATATGEFHVGLNFAGVWKAPCVFWCRNRGTRLGAKAIGYGMPGVRVHGNDVLAVWQVAAEAAERARTGGGPTFVEAVVTDQSDPLARLRGYLKARGLWSHPWESELAERHDQAITEALAAAEAKPAPAASTMFDDVYEELPWHLREQSRG